MTQETEKVLEALGRRVNETRGVLSCQLNDAELIARGDELATAVKALAAEEERQTAQKKAMREELTVQKEAMREELTVLQDHIDRLAKVVKEKAEDRDVLVISELVSTAEGEMVKMVRTDTGEILGLRPATKQELQIGLTL